MKPYRLFFFLALFFFSTKTNGQNRGDLLSDSLVLSYDKTEIQAVYDSFDLPEVLFPIDFEQVEVHRIVYRTLTGRGDSLTVASGLVALPVNTTCQFPMVNYNHGSLTYDEVLSEFKAPLNQHLIGVPFAANGYVAVLPDLLGYGASPLDHPHPYVHAKSEATAVVDMLRATRQLCSALNTGLNDELFLLGYSQGGHTTMAAHRELQQEYAGEFTVTASAPCSGPYDLSGIMFDSMFFSNTFSNPFFIAFATASYQYVYQNLYSKIGEIFQPPYDSLILRMLNRANPEPHLRDSLPVPGYLMFQPDYLAEILADTMHPVRQNLRDNDLYDWAPEAPVHLYYCTADEQVPYVNALFAADHMTDLGADVLAVFSGDLDHFACTPFALIAAKLWFDGYRTPCMIGTEDLASGEAVRVFPNPFRDDMSVVIPGTEPGILRLYDLTGHSLYASSVYDGQTVRLSAQHWAPGVYIAEIQADREVFRFPVVKAVE